MENLFYILSNSFILFYWLYTIYCLMKYSKGISRPEFLGMLFTFNMVIRTRRSIEKIINNFNNKKR